MTLPNNVTSITVHPSFKPAGPNGEIGVSKSAHSFDDHSVGLVCSKCGATAHSEAAKRECSNE